MLWGKLPLPGEGEGGREAAHKMGAFRDPVFRLLHRDPAERSSLRDFHAACNQLFGGRVGGQA